MARTCDYVLRLDQGRGGRFTLHGRVCCYCPLQGGTVCVRESGGEGGGGWRGVGFSYSAKPKPSSRSVQKYTVHQTTRCT
jgi:hypothetical protein